MKSVIIIAIIGISVLSAFVTSEIIWYFANEEFEKARDEFKESLTFQTVSQSNNMISFSNKLIYT